MRTTNNFLVVLPIIFNTSIENYFFIVLIIIFRCIANLFLGLQCFAGKWTGSSLWFPWATILKTLKWRSAFKENAKAKNCQGKKQKGFSSFLQNLSGASSLCVRDEVFWTEVLIKETTKRLHDSYTILTLTEHDMSARLDCSLPNLIPRVFVLHMLAFGTKMLWMRVPLTLNFRKDLPILILTGRHKNQQSQMDTR